MQSREKRTVLSGGIRTRTNSIVVAVSVLTILAAACGGGAAQSVATPTPNRLPTVPPLATVPRLPTVAPLATVARQPTASPTSSEIPTTGGGNSIEHYVLATNTQGAGRNPVGETTVFTPKQAFHLVVTIKDAPDNTTYHVRWYADGTTPTLLGEYDLKTSGSRNLDFTYRPPARGADEGAYHVEIDENGKLAYSAPFIVAQSASENPTPTAAPNAKGHPTATPAAVKVSFIDQAVMAKGVQSDTYEPTDVTTTFSPNDPAIHFVVHLQDAPGGTKLKATLVQDDVIEVATVSVTTPDAGSRFADFSFTPPDGGWEAGDYSAVLYVNEQLNQAVPFTVK